MATVSTDIVFKAVVTLLDAMTHKQREHVRQHLVDQGVRGLAKPRRPAKRKPDPLASPPPRR